MILSQYHGFLIIRILLYSQFATLYQFNPWLLKLQMFQTIQFQILADFKDPLYLRPPDTTRVALISSQQLLIGRDNYGIWSRSMIISLRTKKEVGYIDGMTKKSKLHSPFCLN